MNCRRADGRFAPKNTTVVANGYALSYAPEHPRAMRNGYVYAHILVAEKILGRPIERGEEVHHRDGDRQNNSPENLMVFATKGEHSAFHQAQRRGMHGELR